VGTWRDLPDQVGRAARRAHRRGTDDGAVPPHVKLSPGPPLLPCPVGYAIDPKRNLSAIPSTPIGAVAGV